MRKSFSVFAFLSILSFAIVSCSDLFTKTGRTGSVDFSVDGAYLRSVIAEREGEAFEEADYKLTVLLKGDYTDSKSIGLADLNSREAFILNFDEVPEGAVVYAEVKLFKLKGPAEEFVIMNGTSEKITVAAGQNPLSVKIEWAPLNTKTVTYNSVDGYVYYIDGTPVLSGMQNLLETFCFDNEGNFYTIQQEGDYRLSSTRNDIQNIKLYDDGDARPVLTFDSKTNCLYAYVVDYSNTNTETGTCLCIKRYKCSENMNSKEWSVYTKYTVNNQQEEVWPVICCVYDGTAYILASYSSDNENENSVTYLLYKQKLEEGPKYTFENPDVLNDFPQDNYLELTDMIYQDGAVYILARQVDLNIESEISGDGYYTSRGALIKYDCSTKNLEVLGFAEEKKLPDNTGMYLCYSGYQLFTQVNAPLILNGSSYYKNEAALNSVFPTLCMPAPLTNSLSKTEFYGPHKFVAVKPKRLVISDDGYAFYTNSDGALCWTNVNRLVTVDLERFAILPDTESTEKKFMNDFSSESITATNISSDSFFWGRNGYSSGAIYTDIEGETREYNSGSAYLFIPEGDLQ